MTTEQHISEHMANLSVQDSEHLEELIECARYGELEEIQAVVQTSGPEKAKVLLSHKGDYGKTPLHMAAANGHLGKLKIWKLGANGGKYEDWKILRQQHGYFLRYIGIEKVHNTRWSTLLSTQQPRRQETFNELISRKNFNNN